MPLPAHLRWRHTQRRTAWLFDGQTCVGSLGFGGYGRASGVTSHGMWHLHRLGVLHLGVTVAPADGRQPPLLLRQTWNFDGSLELDGEAINWRPIGSGGQAWCFERTRDRARYFDFAAAGDLQLDTDVTICPAGLLLPDPSPLLLLGAFLVRLAVDDHVVIAGA
ncbi:MAG TPA: hypothetical protein VMF13_24210 [Luteitalea sp.]|nr:hypothetical protein [Luteitalea sp.]